MITDVIATVLMLGALAWGVYVTKHAHEYPEWFEEDILWKDIDGEDRTTREDSRGSDGD